MNVHLMRFITGTIYILLAILLFALLEIFPVISLLLGVVIATFCFVLVAYLLGALADSNL